MESGTKIALVLGGTSAHIALLENLKAREYYTILIDYYDNPPAKKYADEHLKESTLDEEKVLNIAKDRKADLVISTSIDQANVTACYVGEKLNLPIPYSYETALKVTNKILMKNIMLENGIPTSNFLHINESFDLKKNSLKYPLVIKPSDSTGSKGVKKVNNPNELNNNLRKAISLSRNKQVIIEEFVQGEEIQADFFVLDAEARLIMTRKKNKVDFLTDAVLQSIGSIVPADLSEDLKKSLISIAQQITDIFKLKNTSLFIQGILSNGKINIIEFACRIGGGLSYSMIKTITEFDIVNATVNSFLNKPIKLVIKNPIHYYATYLIYANPGVFDRVTGEKGLLDLKIIESFYSFKTRGMSIGPDMASGDRVCAFLVKAETKKDLFSKINTSIEKIDVLDINNQSLIKRLYLK